MTKLAGVAPAFLRRELSQQQMRATVLAWLEKHPGQKGYNGAGLVARALSEGIPLRPVGLGEVGRANLWSWLLGVTRARYDRLTRLIVLGETPYERARKRHDSPKLLSLSDFLKLMRAQSELRAEFDSRLPRSRSSFIRT